MFLETIPDLLSTRGADQQLMVLGNPRLHELITSVIEKIQCREKRKRRLPSWALIYIVLGLSLFRRLSVPNAVSTLFNGLRDIVPHFPFRPASESSICEARYKLGSAPFKALFEAQTEQIIPFATFYGLKVYALDGVRFRVPDTVENETAFGRPKPGRGNTAYPVARVVALIDVYGHRITSVDIDHCDAGERKPVRKVIERLGCEDVVLMDRGYPSGELFQLFIDQKVNFACRITKRWRPHVVRRLGKGDYLVHVTAGREELAPTKVGGRPRFRPVLLKLRMLVYTCGTTLCRILTNLPHSKFPASKIALLYHQRWEGELVFDELKNHFATGLHGSADLCIRSRRAEGVLQELYAMFTTYNFVRDIIATAAEVHGITPQQISFSGTLNAIHLAIPRLVSSDMDKQERLMSKLYQDIAQHCRLRDRRARQYPRVVKIKMSDFKCKTPTDVQTKNDLTPNLTDLISCPPAPGLDPSS